MGHVYHWSSHALLSDVRMRLLHSRGPEPDDEMMESQTDQLGRYNIELVAITDDRDLMIVAERELVSAELEKVVTSSDALAALKIAVGINPNIDPDGGGPRQPVPVSPYQFIAADINRDGRVTSADALEILKNAVNLPTAISAEWVFVPESYSFWDVEADEGRGAYSVDNLSLIHI